MYEGNRYHRLSTILSRVKEIVDSAIANNFFWLKTEIGQLKEDRKGHIYLELVENYEGITLAKCRANIWQSNASVIKNTLGDNAKEILKEGAEIMCYCEVTFSNVYGLSINIHRIDLSYSLGEVERNKQENLVKLKERGYLDLNRTLPIPIVIQHIALVSSAGTAGHADFIKQLEVNENNFVFHIIHFDCQVQGEQAVNSIIAAIDQIPADTYDAIVVIRGGGSPLDLDVFNNYDLAVKIATAHTPVLTGIGHETDNTIADYVSSRYFKTPSAVAAAIVEKATMYYVSVFRSFEEIRQIYKQKMMSETHLLNVNEREIRLYGLGHFKQKKDELHLLSNRMVTEIRKHLNKEEAFVVGVTQTIAHRAQRITHRESQSLAEKARLITFFSQQNLEMTKYKLSNITERLKYQVYNTIKKEKVRLATFDEVATAYELGNILKKGFAIVYHNGERLDDKSTLQVGDELEIAVYNKKYRIELAEIKEINQWNNLLTNKQL
ncbi:exodeoxyribonuclease VII large subunit [Myroides sp. N17-2]|uniref:exodeoxyribonuclease VII large subunit n=1 Tax=Myroides sp. N17-2 TaxID=2030799 RepID=UPI000EFBD7E7|nr:exodeoxyribonuclease VII large subunit [Myroides sp. N17-2]